MRQEIQKIIEKWLEEQDNYYKIIGDDLSDVIMDGMFDLKELIELIIEESNHQ